MTSSDKPNSAAEQKRTERQDADWVILTRCDIRGRLIAQDDLRNGPLESSCRARRPNDA
jgi:hypothetical protein